MVESIRKNKIGILLMICSSIFACLGQLLWKLAVSGSALLLVFGFVLYGLGALVMIVAYKFGKVSILQPVLSLNYVLSVILAATVLKETVTIKKVLGVLIIIFGVLMIAGGDKEDEENASL